MTTPRRTIIEPAVFGSSAIVVVTVLLFALVSTERARALFLGAQDTIATQFGWVFVLSVTLFLLFALWLAFGPHGSVRLGRDDERPEFATLSWFAMLFSAGMGIGVMFYGVAEPVLHYASPPDRLGGSSSAAREAMQITFFHWGLHAWAIYVVMGLAIAYFGFRRGLPLAIRSTLQPLLGERIHGPIGHLVDVLAVFGTLFGLATSLGLGALQINAGLAHLFGVPDSTTVQVLVIGSITACATGSVVLGLTRGIRRLSELNIVLAALLLVFVFVTGPTLVLLRGLPDHIGHYLQEIVEMSLATGSLGSLEWRKSWTLFYWSWWIAWSPFVGLFVARISRGRTIREFVLGVLLVPSLLSFVWFTVFGDTALHQEQAAGGIVAAVNDDVATAIYAVLERLPLAEVSCVLAIFVVAIFFVTSSDSGSFVVDMLTSGGHPDPPVWQRVFWAVTEGAIAAVLLVTGGLTALQSAAVNTGFPFCLVLVAICVSLTRALREEAADG